MATGMDPVQERQVAAIRDFNRFYTRQIGLLEEKLYASEFSLSEARVLYELAHRDGLTASDLARDLGLDAGYLSRILRKMQARGLLVRRPEQSDRRRSLLALTDRGRQAFAPLDQGSRREISTMINPLPAAEREKLVRAMKTIHLVLGSAAEQKVPYILRPPGPGDLGWIVHRQGVLYRQEYGWDETFEVLVAEIAGAFFKNFDPRRERCWIAERDGEVVGSVFLVDGGGDTAKLRLLYVEPGARGLGIGARLVDECISFARERGYRELTLWTNSILVAARRLYETRGFRLVAEEPHHSFGKDLVGQTWVLPL